MASSLDGEFDSEVSTKKRLTVYAIGLGLVVAVLYSTFRSVFVSFSSEVMRLTRWFNSCCRIFSRAAHVYHEVAECIVFFVRTTHTFMSRIRITHFHADRHELDHRSWYLYPYKQGITQLKDGTEKHYFPK
jgi:hypothetical protein